MSSILDRLRFRRRRGGVIIRRLSADGRNGFAIARFAATHQH
nr:MAG TPA: hypothetical protein [Caudoviricetes sp.]